jgi:hypothetical protein
MKYDRESGVERRRAEERGEDAEYMGTYLGTVLRRSP